MASIGLELLVSTPLKMLFTVSQVRDKSFLVKCKVKNLQSHVLWNSTAQLFLIRGFGT